MTLDIDNILDNLDRIDETHCLKCLINEAYEVFHSGSAGRDKELIIKLFEKTDSQCEADIELRLKKIKTSYRVMGISNVGISQVAKKIYRVSKEERQLAIEKRFINFFHAYSDNKNCIDDKGIHQIIYGKYDYGKNGKKQAINLVTKYAYFLTEKNFPIYDKFVARALENLSEEEIQPHVQNININSSDKMPHNFFEVMRAVSTKIGENGVDRFDAFCWTWGKIAESEDGEVSVFDKDKSKEFCQKLKTKNLKLIRPMNAEEKEKERKRKERKKKSRRD